MEKTRQQRNTGKWNLAKTLTLLLCMIMPFWVASCSDSGNTTPNTTGETKKPPTFGNPRPAPLTFLQAQYRASHNSYSGNLEGYRGSIIQQLDAGIRFVEFDIHYSFDGDEVSFNVGHDGDGDEVDHSKNNPPETNDLRWWIARVAKWVEWYKPNEPVIVGLDWKSGFNSNALRGLNDFLVNSEDLVNVSTRLPDYILSPKDFDPNKPITDYRGKIMVVLSGNKEIRVTLAKGYCFETSPCVVNPQNSYNPNDSNEPDPDGPIYLPDAHMFVECQKDECQVEGCEDEESQTDECLLKKAVFGAKSASAADVCSWAKETQEDAHFIRLWQVTDGNYCEWKSTVLKNGEEVEVDKGPNLPATDFPYFGWYARYMEDLSPIPAFSFGDVTWQNHHTPGKGSNPDVAVNNHGYVVEVHKSQNYDTLWYKAGKINGSAIDWISNDTKYVYVLLRIHTKAEKRG